MSNQINFTNEDFKTSEFKYSGAGKKLGEEITKNLSLSQQKALYEKLKGHRGSFDAVRETFKDLKKDTKDGISSNAVSRMEKAFKNRNRKDLSINKNPSLQTRQTGYVSMSSATRVEKANAEIAKRTAGPQLAGSLIKRNAPVMNSGLVVKR